MMIVRGGLLTAGASVVTQRPYRGKIIHLTIARTPWLRPQPPFCKTVRVVSLKRKSRVADSVSFEFRVSHDVSPYER